VWTKYYGIIGEVEKKGDDHNAFFYSDLSSSFFLIKADLSSEID